MTIKISQLGSVAAVQGNVLVPIVSNITGTPTTVKANVDQLQTYILGNAGNIVPAAGNIYSLGNATTWWKDLWLSANTLYIGGVPVGSSGGQLTFGGNAVGTSGLDTYSGNVSAGNLSVSDTSGNATVTIDGTTGNISASAVDVSTVSFTDSIDMKWGSVTGVSVTVGGSGYVQGEYYETTTDGSGTGYQVVAISTSGGNITFAGVGNPGVGYHIGDTVTVVGAGTGNNAVISIDYVSMPVLSSGEYSWSFDDTGTTTFPGNTIIDSSGNISLSDIEGNTTITIDSTTGDISAGNVLVYSVESDTLSLTLPTSASDMLPSYDGGVILSTGTVSTNLNTQYWGFNPYGVTWFTVVDDTGITAGMQIYWAGYIIGTVTGVTSGNVACTPLTASPNFVNGSDVSFGDPAPLYTDTISATNGELLIDGNITLPDNTGFYNFDSNTAVFTSNVINDVTGVSLTDAGNATVYADQGVLIQSNVDGATQTWQFTSGGNVVYPAGQISKLSNNDLYIGSNSGKAVRIASNGGAKAWNFNSNGSVTFPDNTLQISAYTGTSTYSNVQVQAFLLESLPNYAGYVGSNVQVGGNVTYIYNPLSIGYIPTITYANVVLAGTNSANGYVQLNIQNVSSVGTLASADFIATAPNGDDTSKYIDMGINGNNYSSSSWTISGANDGYVYVNSGNLTLGTDTPNTTVKVHVGGTLASNVITTFSSSNVTIGGNLIVGNTYTPTLANSTGTAGQIAWDNNYVYICIATNTWKRANISTW